VRREKGEDREIAGIQVPQVPIKPTVPQVRRVNRVHVEGTVHKGLPVRLDLKVIPEHGDQRVTVVNQVNLVLVDRLVKMVRMVTLVIMVAVDHEVQRDHLDPRVSRAHRVAMVPLASQESEVRSSSLT
jgi:hypothetical protein